MELISSADSTGIFPASSMTDFISVTVSSALDAFSCKSEISFSIIFLSVRSATSIRYKAPADAVSGFSGQITLIFRSFATIQILSMFSLSSVRYSFVP